MSRPRSKKSVTPPTQSSVAPVPDAAPARTCKTQPDLPPRYLAACRLAQEGKYDDARRIYAKLKRSATSSNTRLRALIRNDLAVLAAIEGKVDEAREQWREAIEADPECLLARLNRDLVEAEIRLATVQDDFGELKLAPAPGQAVMPARTEPRPPRTPDSPVRVAILSFLFNWPSTGGGNHHTAELAAFLARAGYEVKHYFARYPGWGIGRVTDELISPSEAIEFDEPSWNVAEIQARFRRAVERLQARLRHHHRLLEHEAAPGRGGARLPLLPALPGAGEHLPAQ